MIYKKLQRPTFCGTEFKKKKELKKKKKKKIKQKEEKENNEKTVQKHPFSKRFGIKMNFNCIEWNSRYNFYCKTT